MDNNQRPQGPVGNPKDDIMYQAAMLRQKKYWEELIPKLEYDQVGMIMTVIVQAVNVLNSLDMIDSMRICKPFRSQLAVHMQMVAELLKAPPEETGTPGAPASDAPNTETPSA